mmetsp:Transcript_95746/g.143426  ORF Transcript_95746/g.143426 Transcript_95746/m.143426 type:complete len:238 (-) Transcript_95746:43-756(-)
MSGLSLTPEERRQLITLPPEQKNGFLMHLRAKQQRANKQQPPAQMPQCSSFPQHNILDVQYNGTMNVTPPLATIQTQEPTQKRRRGGGPRKCNNPSCDRIVTKRNFCYKCQKRKERGLPMGPRLPSVSHVLQQNSGPTSTLPPINFNEQNAPKMTTLKTIIQPSTPPSPMACETNPSELNSKMDQLHSYLLGLTGSEDNAKELVQSYLHRAQAQAIPRGNFSNFSQPQPQENTTRFY